MVRISADGFGEGGKSSLVCRDCLMAHLPFVDGHGRQEDTCRLYLLKFHCFEARKAANLQHHSFHRLIPASSYHSSKAKKKKNQDQSFSVPGRFITCRACLCAAPFLFRSCSSHFLCCSSLSYNPRRIRPTLFSPSLKILLLYCCCFFIGLASPTLSRSTVFLPFCQTSGNKTSVASPPNHQTSDTGQSSAFRAPQRSTSVPFSRYGVVICHSSLPVPSLSKPPPAESTSKGPRHPRPYFSSLPSPVNLLAKSLPHSERQ